MLKLYPNLIEFYVGDYKTNPVYKAYGFITIMSTPDLIRHPLENFVAFLIRERIHNQPDTQHPFLPHTSRSERVFLHLNNTENTGKL